MFLPKAEHLETIPSPHMEYPYTTTNILHFVRLKDTLAVGVEFLYFALLSAVKSLHIYTG